MNFSQYLRTKLKKVIGVSLLSAMISMLILPVFNTRAADETVPRFNFRAGDHELLSGRNHATPTADFSDPISGVSTDTFEGVIYYHNGYENTIAKDTTIKLSIPSETVDKTAKLSASISSPDAATVTDTVIDGAVFGKSGLTLNLSDKDATLALVPGSVKWYPETQSKGTTTPTDLLDSLTGTPQTGDEITSSVGLNIGSIQGCWPYAGEVRFQFKATPKVVNANLTVQKQVLNVSQDETIYQDATNAAAGEEVAYSVSFTNNGTQDVVNPTIKDALPNTLTYVPDSMDYFAGGPATSLSNTVVASIFGAGWVSDATIAPGETEGIRFHAKVNNGVSVGQSAINTGSIIVNDQTFSDTATVNFVGVNIKVEKSKTVLNNSTGVQASDKTDAGKTIKSLSAKAGEQITYTLTTKNVDTVAGDYIVQDGIADILEYADVINISDGGAVVDGTTGNDAKLVRYPSTNIAVGQTITRTFTAKLKDPLPNNPAKGYSYDDKLFNNYGNDVIVNVERPVVVKKVDLSIVKEVRDFTTNQTAFAKENQAFAGDTLEYRISFKNAGNAPADAIKFSDVLPPNTQYFDGTTIISRNGDSERTVIDGITKSGILLDSIAAGESGYIRFKVSTSAQLAAGEVLTNTVTLSYTGGSLNDSAKTTIIASTATPTAPIASTGLPKTGATATSAFLLTFMLSVAYLYARYQKEIAGQFEILKIAGDIAGL